MLQLLDTAILDWPRFGSWCFYFSENNSSALQADPVWDASDAGAHEFPANPADGCNRGLQFVF